MEEPRWLVVDFRDQRREGLKRALELQAAKRGLTARVEAWAEAAMAARPALTPVLLLHGSPHQLGRWRLVRSVLEGGGCVLLYAGTGLTRASLPNDLKDRPGLYLEPRAQGSSANPGLDLEAWLPRLLAPADSRQPFDLSSAAMPSLSCGPDLLADSMAIRASGYWGPILLQGSRPRGRPGSFDEAWYRDPSLISEGEEPSRYEDQHANAARFIGLTRGRREWFSIPGEDDVHDVRGRVSALFLAGGLHRCALGCSTVAGEGALDSLELFDRVVGKGAYGALERVLASALRRLLLAEDSATFLPPRACRSLSIWVIDDFVGMGWRQLFQALLPEHSLQFFPDEARACDALAELPRPDLAFVDLYLEPHSDMLARNKRQFDKVSGVRVINRLHSAHPGLPVVLFTSSENAPLVQAAQRSPPAAYQPKPAPWQFHTGSSGAPAGDVEDFASLLVRIASCSRQMSRNRELQVSFQGGMDWMNQPPWRESREHLRSLLDIAMQFVVEGTRLDEQRLFPQFHAQIKERAARATESSFSKEERDRLRAIGSPWADRMSVSLIILRNLRNLSHHLPGALDVLDTDERGSLARLLVALVDAAVGTASAYERLDEARVRALAEKGGCEELLHFIDKRLAKKSCPWGLDFFHGLHLYNTKPDRSRAAPGSQRELLSRVRRRHVEGLTTGCLAAASLGVELPVGCAEELEEALEFWVGQVAFIASE